MDFKNIISKRTFPLILLNSITLIFTILVNYFGGTGIWGKPSVGDISNLYPTLITPASYAFSIWGMIYLLLIAYIGHQWYRFGIKKPRVVNEAGLWFTLSNLANAAWIYFWLQEMQGISVLVIFFLLFCLIQLVRRHRLEIFHPNIRYIALVWWPICIYVGWIVLAATVNTTVWLSSSADLGQLLSPEIWAVGVIAIATSVYMFLIYHRNMREAALVGVWGFIAIAVKQAASPPVQSASVIAAAILLCYAGYHAYQNRASLPHKQLNKNQTFS